VGSVGAVAGLDQAKGEKKRRGGGERQLL